MTANISSHPPAKARTPIAVNLKNRRTLLYLADRFLIGWSSLSIGDYILYARSLFPKVERPPPVKVVQAYCYCWQPCGDNRYDRVSWHKVRTG